MMQGEKLILHVRGPIGEDIRQLGCIADTKSEIYVRPPIFACSCRRAGDRGTTEAPVFGSIFQEVGAQAIPFFRGKHSGLILKVEMCSILLHFAQHPQGRLTERNTPQMLRKAFERFEQFATIPRSLPGSLDSDLADDLSALLFSLL